jgi:hypothetical protein
MRFFKPITRQHLVATPCALVVLSCAGIAAAGSPPPPTHSAKTPDAAASSAAHPTPNSSHASPAVVAPHANPGKAAATNAVTKHETEEIKVTVAPNQADAVLKLLKLKPGSAEREKVFFADTPNLALFKAGRILRARQIHGDPDESTVKLRPVKASQVDPHLAADPGFKYEADRVGNKAVPSASLTLKVPRGAIRKVVHGKTGLGSLFASDQEDMLTKLGGKPINFDNLSVLGPAKVQKWKVEPKDGPPLAVERWELPDGEVVLEVSTRTAYLHGDAASQGLSKFLAAHKINADKTQETKTQEDVDYFSRQLLAIQKHQKKE